MLHIMLVILMTLMIGSQVQQNQTTLRNQQFVFYKKFLLIDGDVPTMDDFARDRHLYTIDDLKSFADSSLSNYYLMLNSTDNEFETY